MRLLLGPEERGEAAQREREAVEEDVAAFRHVAGPLGRAVIGDDGTAKHDNSCWLKGPENVVSGDSRDPSLRSG